MKKNTSYYYFSGKDKIEAHLCLLTDGRYTIQWRFFAENLWRFFSPLGGGPSPRPEVYRVHTKDIDKLVNKFLSHGIGFCTLPLKRITCIDLIK